MKEEWKGKKKKKEKNEWHAIWRVKEDVSQKHNPPTKVTMPRIQQLKI